MRPERAIVKKAIQDADGNLSRAAALLGCTRQSLYTWIYQLGLERLAGIRMDTPGLLDKRRRMDNGSLDTRRVEKSGVQSTSPTRPILHVVEATTETDRVVPATVKIRESVWKRLKIRAIEEDTTMGAIVEKALEPILGSVKRAGTK